MNRPLIVVAGSSVVTCLGWWAKCAMEGTTVALSSTCDEGCCQAKFVVAELRSEAEAKAFYRTLNERISLKARWFDARDWPGVSNGTSEPVTGS